MIVNRKLATYPPDEKISYDENNDVRNNSPYDIGKPDETARAIQRLVVLFQMTYIGGPVVYYGDEAGMWGAHDPDERMPMVWADLKFDLQKTDPRGKTKAADDPNFDPSVFDFYRSAIALRKDHPALQGAKVCFLGSDDQAMTFSMVRGGPGETLVVAFNRGDQPSEISFPSPEKDWTAPKVIFSTGQEMPKISRDQSDWKTVLPPLTGVVISGKD